LVVVTVVVIGSASPARADIFQWEYINPADLSQGKQQSTTLAPDGAGVNAVPGAQLPYRDLTMAYLIGADLRNADFHFGALTDADLTGAVIRGANFDKDIPPVIDRGGTGLTLAQIYSTASYQAHDLSGISLVFNNLAGGNFTDQNLANANFDAARLTEVDFTGAKITGASFNIRQKKFGDWGSGISLDQLYSTASYQAHDLSGIALAMNDLMGGNFSGQNLFGADFDRANLTNANFRRANLANASLGNRFFSTGPNLTSADFNQANLINTNFHSATLTNANFTAADARGAFINLSASAVFTNLIRPDGHIDGLDLEGGAMLVIRDYDGNPFHTQPTPIPILVDQHLSMAASGALRMEFEADAWDSTISFAPGIPVTLGGTLELTFAPDVNPADQISRTFHLFNWTGVTPIGSFAISSPYRWNLSNLYATGEVTLTAVPEPAASVLVVVAAVGVRRMGRRTRQELVNA
jgi:uncharacterized protein YjbI with pentapeptide repeats